MTKASGPSLRAEILARLRAERAAGDPFAVRVVALRALAGVGSLPEDLSMALAALPEQELARWFAHENPAVRAVMFCLVPAVRRAGLQGELGAADRTALLQATGALLESSEDALRVLLDAALERLHQSSSARTRMARPGGREAVRALVAGMASHDSSLLLENLALRDKALASDLRASLITVEKLAGLFLPDLAKALCAVPEKTLVVFLYGVRATRGIALAEAFFAAFSASRRAELESQMECLTRVTRKDVDTAIACFVSAALALEQTGAICFPWKEKWVS